MTRAADLASLGHLPDGAVTEPRLAAGATLKLATPQATTSGSSVDFTGIPAGVKEIVVMLNGVSTNGVAGIGLQLGDAGGIETSGYAFGWHGVTTAAAGFGGSSTGSFATSAMSAASAAIYGVFVLTLMDAATNTWACRSTLYTDEGTDHTQSGAGIKALSATLDRVRLLCGGSDTFDGGTVNIAYK